MNARLIAVWLRIKASYWFIPSMMSLLAVVISIFSIQIDGIVSDRWVSKIGWLNANEPEGARLLLSTIAGSMIGVAGITFSITIAAVAFASGQFGPRILTNFMRDRANQVTLGVFISTFLYCLLVLRTIQSSGNGAFIPHFSVLIGVLFAISSIGVLIHFIHHIAESIHVSTAMSRVGRQLIQAVDVMFPEKIGQRHLEAEMSEEAAEEIRSRFGPAQSARLASSISGYVQALADERLLKIARDNDLTIRLARQPGDFTAPGRTLMWVWPADRANDDVLNALGKTIAVGTQRTPDQDIRFLVEQLTDMAGRALSPGINDPYTAASCVNWLGAAISELASRCDASAYRYDADEKLRVVATPLTFASICGEIFGALRQHVETNGVAAERMMETMNDVLGDTSDAQRRHLLGEYADELMEGVERQLAHPADVARVRNQYALFGARLENKTDLGGVSSTAGPAWTR